MQKSLHRRYTFKPMPGSFHKNNPYSLVYAVRRHFVCGLLWNFSIFLMSSRMQLVQVHAQMNNSTRLKVRYCKNNTAQIITVSNSSKLQMQRYTCTVPPTITITVHSTVPKSVLFITIQVEEILLDVFERSGRKCALQVSCEPFQTQRLNSKNTHLCVVAYGTENKIQDKLTWSTSRSATSNQPLIVVSTQSVNCHKTQTDFSINQNVPTIRIPITTH